jgi:hypothetical protein
MNFQDWIQNSLECSMKTQMEDGFSYLTVKYNGEILWEDVYGAETDAEKFEKQMAMSRTLMKKWQTLYPDYNNGVRWSYTGPTYTSEIYTPYIDKFVEEQRKGGEIVLVKYYPK